MTSDCCLPAPPNTSRYLADEITIYGVKLNKFKHGAMELPQVHGDKDHVYTMRFGLWVDEGTGSSEKELDASKYAIAVAYGYAYEGHCYRFDKPRILLFLTDPKRGDVEAKGCGFDTAGSAYRMWRVKSKTIVLELTVSTDFAEAVLLEANLPGRRAPNTYNSNMMMAHRGGRLTESRS